MNFGNYPDDHTRFDSAAIAVLPVPFDASRPPQQGADVGPRALLAASAGLERYDIETETEVWRRGIFTAAPVADFAGPEEMTRGVEEQVRNLMEQDKFVVVLGGEHTVAVGAVRAHARRHPDLSVLQLDAHADLRQEDGGSRFSHACAMARVREICPAVQVGVRSLDACEIPGIVQGHFFPAEQILGLEDDLWIPDVIARLTRHVYVTIDLDVFDCSLMPCTGRPEPGGLDWYSVLRLLRRLTETRTVVGFDVVGLCPHEGYRAPDFVAAKLVYKLLSYVWKNRPQPAARRNA